MHTYQWLLFLHLLAVMLWLGGAVIGTLLGTALRRAGDTRSMAAFCAAFAKVAGPAFGGAGLVVLLTGIGMVAQSGGPSFDAAWVHVGFIGWLVSFVLGATVVGRSWYTIGNDLAADGATIDALYPRISRALAWTWADVAIRVAVVLVMVWKPT